MRPQTRILRLRLLVLAVLLGLAAGCASPTPVVVEVTRLAPATVVVTQLVTPEATPTAATPPTETPTPDATATATVEALPFVYYPIPDCGPSRLKVGDVAYVTYDGGDSAIRNTPDVDIGNNIIDFAAPGAELTIIGGPECSFGWVMWRVRTHDDIEGWTPEGDGTRYFILPVGN